MVLSNFISIHDCISMVFVSLTALSPVRKGQKQKFHSWVRFAQERIIFIVTHTHTHIYIYIIYIYTIKSNTSYITHKVAVLPRAFH
jgi:hypothetical protein